MDSEQRDLGDLLYRLSRAVLARETAVLAAFHVEMWDYAVLCQLKRGPAPTQSQLATSVGRDATRLIAILDRLETRGLARRDPDPRDRRNRIVTLTDPGRAVLAECRDAVRGMERNLLADIEPVDHRALLATLQQVHHRLSTAELPAQSRVPDPTAVTV